MSETRAGGVFEGIVKEPLPEGAEVLEEYWLEKPYSRVVIAIPPGETGPRYYLIEPELSPDAKKALAKLSEAIESEVNPADFEKAEDLRRAVEEYIDKLVRKYSGLLRKLSDEDVEAIKYYLRRNFIGLGHVEPLLQDPNLEDISCNGLGIPIHVWHRRYESMPTNIIFTSKTELDNYVVGLAHRAGKHVSAAFPIVDAMLAGQHRLAATYREEVSPEGSSFTIRKFRTEPFSIIDQIRMGTISLEMAAYLWLLIDNKFNLMVIGGTGAGKTSLLNSLCNFIRPAYKVVTVEETPELNLPLQNWVKLVTREAYGAIGTISTRITLYDLVKTSLRYRPDYIIVGEIRGEEAYVLFQALATGHGGLSTMHAESLDSAVKRLVSPPMNISPAYIPLMNAVLLIERMLLPTRGGYMAPARRVRTLWEVIEHENYYSIAEYDTRTNSFIADFSASYLLRKIGIKSGKTLREMVSEMEERRLVLEWMLKKNITRLWDVSKIITEYYISPNKVVERAVEEIRELKEVETTRAEVITDGTSIITSILERSAGKTTLRQLLTESRMDEALFWDSLSKLINEGVIVLKDDGTVELVAKRVE